MALDNVEIKENFSSKITGGFKTNITRVDLNFKMSSFITLVRFIFVVDLILPENYIAH